MIQKIYDLPCSAVDLLKLFQSEPHVFLLDSSLFEESRGRFSFLGFDPFYMYRQKGNGSLNKLKEKFYQYTGERPKSETPLSCGMVGFLGYDFGLCQERIAPKAEDDLHLPDCVFGFYDTILTLDHLKGKLIVTSSGLPERDPFFQQAKVKERLHFIEKKLSLLDFKAGGNRVLDADVAPDSKFKSNFTKEQYVRVVQKALRYIEEGDIYQVNLSHRFSLEAPAADPLKLYQTLRQISPSSFGGYFDAGDFQIISSSPEEFLCLRDGWVQTRPMKGTRPRGKTESEDEKFRLEMTESAKEKAELLMITDLERNDLGRVCEYGSIRVKEMRAIEAYRTVYQATSTVEGKLHKSKDAFDVLRACFPGGSITGCPKIRAMEIIDELEPARRGIYTGSLGYMDFSGNMDFNILIRTLLKKENNIYFQVGSGIVADSKPLAEYEETLVKAQAMKAAILRSLSKAYPQASPAYSPAL